MENTTSISKNIPVIPKFLDDILFESLKEKPVLEEKAIAQDFVSGLCFKNSDSSEFSLSGLAYCALTLYFMFMTGVIVLVLRYYIRVYFHTCPDCNPFLAQSSDNSSVESSYKRSRRSVFPCIQSGQKLLKTFNGRNVHRQSTAKESRNQEVLLGDLPCGSNTNPVQRV